MMRTLLPAAARLPQPAVCGVAAALGNAGESRGACVARAQVYKGIWQGNTPVAVKFVTGHSPKERARFRNEVAILQSLRHVNIVQFLGASLAGDQIMLVTEYMPRGDLWRALSQDSAHHFAWRNMCAAPLSRPPSAVQGHGAGRWGTLWSTQSGGQPNVGVQGRLRGRAPVASRMGMQHQAEVSTQPRARGLRFKDHLAGGLLRVPTPPQHPLKPPLLPLYSS